MNNISEVEKQKRWNNIHLRAGNRNDIRGQYDGWLEKHNTLMSSLKSCSTPILDLGCGIGIDTLHLIDIGCEVVACDFSDEAIKKVNENIPEAKTRLFNMKNKMPFDNETFEIVIANKSIHYFSEKETKYIILELHRIIKTNGLLAIVVNSTKDSNFGAGKGTKLEENFYEIRGTTKRFFDKESLQNFFENSNWEFISIEEIIEDNGRIKAVQLNGEDAVNKKVTWCCILRRI